MSEHNHEEGCGCGCGCGHDHEEELKVTLTLDNDEEVVCIVLTIFPAGKYEYIALLPENDNEEGEVFLYRYSESEDGEPILENIEDDDEYEIAADAFDELLDSAEYDELVDAEDE